MTGDHFLLPSLCSLQSIKHTSTLYLFNILLLPGAITSIILLYSDAVKCLSDGGTNMPDFFLR